MKGLKWITIIAKIRQSVLFVCGKAGHAKITICESQNEFY